MWSGYVLYIFGLCLQLFCLDFGRYKFMKETPSCNVSVLHTLCLILVLNQLSVYLKTIHTCHLSISLGQDLWRWLQLSPPAQNLSLGYSCEGVRGRIQFLMDCWAEASGLHEPLQRLPLLSSLPCVHRASHSVAAGSISEIREGQEGAREREMGQRDRSCGPV